MRTTLVVLALTSCASVATADLRYTTDRRTISAQAQAGNDAPPVQSASATAPVFNTSVHVRANNTSGGGGSSDATATQHSELLSDRITGTGGGSVAINFGGGSQGSYTG